MIMSPRTQNAINGNVVIVEDDELLQQLLVDIFAELGGCCTAFFTADDALMHMMQTRLPYALLVTDFTLPGQLNGKDLACMVRQRWPNVPVIITTGHDNQIALGLPVEVAFLRKPWSVELMVQTAL